MPKSSKSKVKDQPGGFRFYTGTEAKINKLISKVDRSKKPWEQTGLSDDELKYLVEALTPIKRYRTQDRNAIIYFRKHAETIWRTFMYGMLVSEIQERELSHLDSVWPEWEDELAEKQCRQILEAIRDGRLVLENNKNRERRTRVIDPYFNWLEPHTIVEYAEAIAVNRKTVEKFVKSIRARPSSPARGPHSGKYPPTVGFKIFKAWLTNLRWLTVNKLKRTFPVDNKKSNIKQPDEAELRIQLGKRLLDHLPSDKGNKRLKEKFRKMIHMKLPGSEAAWLEIQKQREEKYMGFLDGPILSKFSIRSKFY